MFGRLLLLALLAPASATAGSPQSARPVCSFGPEEPSLSDQLRPGLTASCDYGPTELNRRVLDLLRHGGRSLEIAEVERIFGLPRLRTSFDDPRTANYAVVFAAAPGRPRWRAMLSFSESYFPIDARRRPRFRGTLRPARIGSRRGETRLDLTWLEPRELVFGSPACLSTERLIDEEGRSGWRSGTTTRLVLDAGPMPMVELERGRVSAVADFVGPGACVRDFAMTREADPGAD